MNRRATEFVFDAYSREVAVDPHPFYRVMRDEHPVLWCESTRAWALSRYEDVLAALLDPQTFSSAKGNIVNDNPARAGRTLGTTDPPKHDQLRGLVNEAFARRTVSDFETPMREMAEHAIDKLLSVKGSVDLRSGLAFPSSAAVLGEVLGVELTKQASLADAFMVVLDEPLRLGADPADDIPERAVAMGQVLGVVGETIRARQSTPGSDVVSSLIQAGLTEEELTWIMFTFLGAGLESSTAQFLLAVRSLALHPEARARLAENLDLIPTAYEELVRFDCGPNRFHRTLTRDIEMHGKKMKEGESVLVMYGSANRDGRRFERPDELVIDRHPNPHLGFGRGPHFCLGAPLARLQAKVLLEVLLTRAPNYRVHEDQLEWKVNPGFRGVKSLPVTLSD
jgi:cytochrome P450